MKLAQIQMHVAADKAANIRRAEDLLRSVRRHGHPARDVLLPLRQRLLPRLRRA